MANYAETFYPSFMSDLYVGLREKVGRALLPGSSARDREYLYFQARTRISPWISEWPDKMERMIFAACEDQAWREGERVDREGSIGNIRVRLGRKRNVIDIKNGREINTTGVLGRAYTTLYDKIVQSVSRGEGTLKFTDPLGREMLVKIDEFDARCVIAHTTGLSRYRAFTMGVRES